jgi:uncharacterized protein
MDATPPPTDAELDRLDDFFARRPPTYDDMPLSCADGFIAAAALSPEFVAPKEWMVTLLGDFDTVFADKFEANEVSGIVWKRHTEIVACLQAEPPTFQPLLDRDEEGWPLGEIWAEGFLLGMGLRIESWSPLLDHPAGSALMLPILALGDPQVMAEIEPRKAKRSREAGRLTALLADSLPVLEKMTRALREDGDLNDVAPPADLLDRIAGKAGAASKPAAPQVGRNDPCPCGSGQKYKRCCGAAA